MKYIYFIKRKLKEENHVDKEYKVYASQAKCAYSGYSLIAAESATRANEII